MPDELLNLRYRLETEIGRGGMGSVYRAYDTLLDRPVAVKVLSEAGIGSRGRERLWQDARHARQPGRGRPRSRHREGAQAAPPPPLARRHPADHRALARRQSSAGDKQRAPLRAHCRPGPGQLD